MSKKIKKKPGNAAFAKFAEEKRYGAFAASADMTSVLVHAAYDMQGDRDSNVLALSALTMAQGYVEAMMRDGGVGRQRVASIVAKSHNFGEQLAKSVAQTMSSDGKMKRPPGPRWDLEDA